MGAGVNDQTWRESQYLKFIRVDTDGRVIPSTIYSVARNELELFASICTRNEVIAHSEYVEKLALIVDYVLRKGPYAMPMVSRDDSLELFAIVVFELLYCGGYDKSDPTQVFEGEIPDSVLHRLSVLIERAEVVGEGIADLNTLYCIIEGLGGLRFALEATDTQISEAVKRCVQSQEVFKIELPERLDVSVIAL